MFEPVEYRIGAGRRLLTLSVSIVLHAVVITALVLIPLMYYDVLPTPQILTFLAVPPMPPPPPPPPAPPVRVPHFVKHVAAFVAPTRIPKSIPPPTDEAPIIEESTLGGIPGGVTGGVMGGTPGGILGGALGIHAPAQLPPPPPPKPVVRSPIRLGGDVLSGKLIYRVNPEYPALARYARVQGPVAMEVTVDEKGKVTNVRVLHGHPLLEDAAVQAVEKWKFKPTFLDGKPVPVIATVTINFALNG